MVGVIFYCNWNEGSTSLLERYKTVTKNSLGVWNNLVGVSDLDVADCVVFIEGIPDRFDMQLLKDKTVICLPREPFNNKNWEHLNLKYGFTYNTIHHVVTNFEFLNKTYDFMDNLEYYEHPKLVSAVISNKSNGEGYTIRRNFTIELSKRFPDLCDVYGSGWSNELGLSYKGALAGYRNKNSGKTKYDGLINYKYTLCFENCSKKNYFTEKLTDAILCWTIPIYWGCSNIDDYFPGDCYYYLDITKDRDSTFDRLNDIIKQPITQKNRDALKEARDLILNKYNIWPTVSSIFL